MDLIDEIDEILNFQKTEKVPRYYKKGHLLIFRRLNFGYYLVYRIIFLTKKYNWMKTMLVFSIISRIFWNLTPIRCYCI